MSIRDLVRGLESSGHSALLAAGRQALAAWMDSKPTLRSLRLEAGLSQEQLAAAMSTSQPQIARMESGKQDLQLSTMKRLADALNINLHKIVDAASG